MFCVLGGREAEMVHFGDAGSADVNDVRMAKEIALRLTAGDPLMADKRIARERRVARKLLHRERPALAILAEALLDKRTVMWPETVEMTDKALRSPRLKFAGRRQRKRADGAWKSRPKHRYTGGHKTKTPPTDTATRGERIIKAMLDAPMTYRDDGVIL